MKLLIAFILALSASLVGCSDSTDPSQAGVGFVKFHGQTFVVESTVAIVDVIPVASGIYLKLKMSTRGGGLVQFAVRSPDADFLSLLTVGAHKPLGGIADFAVSDLTDIQVGFNYLTEDDLSIVWESTTIEGDSFTGHGYVLIRARLNYACADSIRTAVQTYYPGDPEYDSYFERYCAPEFYFPAQRISFSVTEGMIAPE